MIHQTIHFGVAPHAWLTAGFRVVEVDSRQTVLARNDSFYRTLPDRTRPVVVTTMQ